MERRELDGKVAVITGAGRGLGRTVALAFAERGAAVAVLDIRPDTAAQVTAEAAARGARSLPVVGDVSIGEDVNRMMAEVVQAFGQIDILVTFAGYFGIAPAIELKESDWDRTIAINLKGTFLCCVAAAKHMIPRGGGKIVTIASGRGVTGQPGAVHYAASKGGVIGLTVTLGIELAPYGINVNALCPGATDTPGYRSHWTDDYIKAAAERPHHKRLGQPEDVVGPVLFLVTDASKTMFGQIVHMKTP